MATSHLKMRMEPTSNIILVSSFTIIFNPFRSHVNIKSKLLLSSHGQRSIYVRKCFAFLQLYFNQTSLVGTVYYTNIFVNVSSASCCHLEVII
jgi:hypothetical protein